jgi:sensor histidine kinase regulating citrate/malate metabolism
MTKLQLEQQEYFVNETKKNFEEMSQIRHDTKNYLLCIEELLKDNNTDEAIRYIQALKEEKLSNTRKYVNTHSDVVNAIINSKFSKCQDNNIAIDYNITGDFSNVSDVDISILLSNLLDNSIEACLKCNIDTTQKIFISICDEKGYLHIVVKNTIKKSVLERNPTLKTTKSNNKYHGFGTLTIRDIVNKYDGSIDVYERNLEFFSDILLKTVK